MNTEFADIYEGDPIFNAHAYASAGHPLIVLKAYEFRPDQLHATRSEQAHQARLPVGHYAYVHPEHGNPLGQARAFWDTARPHYRHAIDFLICDLETGPPGTWSAWLTEWERELLRVSTLGPEKLVGYAPLSGIQEAGPRLQLRGNRWWPAAWGPRIRTLGAGRHIWAQQHTDSHSGPGPYGAAGIGPCDMSTLNAASARYYHNLRR